MTKTTARTNGQPYRGPHQLLGPQHQPAFDELSESR
jgi:hypothetical protein